MTTILALAALSAMPQSHDISAYLQTGFRDAMFTAKVLQKNQRELAKINDDFEEGYRFDSTSVRMKEPYQLRLDAKVEDTTMSYVVNGPRRLIKIPRLRVNVKQDLSKKPGSRQTIMDFGVLTPSLFTDFLDAKFVRVDRATNDVVFDLTYKAVLKDKTRYRVWIDPDKKFITKREWYHRKGRMVATFIYDTPTSANGATMPTRLTVKNADDVVAGVTRYDAIKLNGGITDDVFGL